MEEDEYKSTYNALTSIRCVFEKAITTNRAQCRLSEHFCLADREGYACTDVRSSGKCRKILEIFRKKSVFVLKLQKIKGPLPHNMEIRVQVGGITGLMKRLETQHGGQSEQPAIEDIQGLIKQAIEKIGPPETWPYSEIIQSVVQFQGRRRRQR